MTAPATVIDLSVAAARSRRIAWESARWLPLVVILVAQALLSLRLLYHVAPFPSGDEGRDIYGGHQLIHEFWHGGGSPYLETYFSGAPVIYPVLAAMVDHVAGLTGARLMSLEFMMTATVLLFASARRLFGYWAGVTAAGLFAVIALTQNLGVYATYDVMSLMLLTVAAYCAVRSLETRWLLLVPLALLAANATKYATIVFDPIVMALAALQVASSGWRRVVTRFGALGVTITTLLLLAAGLAGMAYVKGAMWTTFNRNPKLQSLQGGGALLPAHVIFSESWHWIGAVIAVSLLALVCATVGRDWDQAAVLGVLVLAGSLVTLESVHLHSAESMWKHDDFAVWFACAAAGAIPVYVADLAGGRRGIRILLGAISAAVVVAAVGANTIPQATDSSIYATRPLEAKAAGVLRPYLAHGRFLMGAREDDATLYYEHLAVPWWGHFDDLYIKYPIPGRGGNTHDIGNGLICYSLKPHCVYLEGPAGYRAAIRAHWFDVITLVGQSGPTVRARVIAWTAAHTPGYVLLTQAGGAPTWILASAYQGSHHAR